MAFASTAASTLVQSDVIMLLWNILHHKNIS